MKRVYSAVKRRMRRWSWRGGPRAQAAFYRFFGETFAREQVAMASGIARHRQRPGDTQLTYHLRRHTHMLEKGLTMRPRRITFATGYIESVVAGLDLLTSGGRTAIGVDELDWIVDVLQQYFEATTESEADEIVRARANFGKLNLSGIDYAVRRHGALPVGQLEPDEQSYKVLQDLAYSRRSVRWYLDAPVPRDVVAKAFKVAGQAPTACNRQPYRFIVVDTPESIAKIASIPMGTRGYAHQIPGLVVVVGDQSAFFDERDRHVIYIDSSLASMGFILGLQAQGVGSCCINWPDVPAREEAIAAELELERHERVVMLITYGFADPEGLAPSSAKGEIADSLRYLDGS